jgi:amino acid permease
MQPADPPAFAPLPVRQTSFLTAFVFNVNVLMGSGILAMPFAFYISGWALGSVVLVVFSILSWVTIRYNFEAQMRAYVLAVAWQRGVIRFVAPDDANSADGLHSGLLDSQRQCATATETHSACDENEVDVVVEVDADTVAQDSKNQRGSDYIHTPKASQAVNAHSAPRTAMDQLLDQLNAVKKISPIFATPVMVSTLVDLPRSASEEITRLNASGEGDFKMLDFSIDDVDFDAFQPDDYWEINDILLLFGGRVAMYGWNVCNIVFQIAILWTFSVVLGATATLGIPIVGITAGKPKCNSNDSDFGSRSECLAAIKIWFVVFAAINILLVARDWGFMATLQRFFAVLVYVCVGVIVVTCIIGMAQHDFPGAAEKTKDDGAYVQSIAVWDMNGFGGLFGVCVFALLCHSATSLILKQMPSTRVVKRVFTAAFTAITFLYGAMGLIVAFYIGNRVEKVVTLDWSIYREWGAHDWFGTAIGNIVLFFPVLSITPGFVLRTRSLCDAVETMIPLHAKQWISATLLRAAYQRSGKGLVYRFQLVLRVIAILVALGLSMVSYHFQKALQISGCAGFTILFMFPLISELRSRAVLERLGLPSRTPFHDWCSYRVTHVGLALLGVLSFCYYFYLDFIHPPHEPKTGLNN